jgi:hypothetical protein
VRSAGPRQRTLSSKVKYKISIAVKVVRYLETEACVELNGTLPCLSSFKHEVLNPNGAPLFTQPLQNKAPYTPAAHISRHRHPYDLCIGIRPGNKCACTNYPALMAMMARLSAGGVPWWQPLLSALLLAGTAVVIVRAVAGMFRAQALLSGQGIKVRTYLMALVGKA